MRPGLSIFNTSWQVLTRPSTAARDERNSWARLGHDVLHRAALQRLLAPRLLSLLLIASPLAGCGSAAPPAETAVGVVPAAAIPIFHRAPTDMVANAATGRDCPVVHLDAAERYCKPKEPPPEPPLFCTRSLGVVDCWDDPAKLPNHPREVADGPRTLTKDQEADRAKPWPWLW